MRLGEYCQFAHVRQKWKHNEPEKPDIILVDFDSPSVSEYVVYSNNDKVEEGNGISELAEEKTEIDASLAERAASQFSNLRKRIAAWRSSALEELQDAVEREYSADGGGENAEEPAAIEETLREIKDSHASEAFDQGQVGVARVQLADLRQLFLFVIRCFLDWL